MVALSTSQAGKATITLAPLELPILGMPPAACTVGWDDLKKLKVTRSMLCQIVVGPQFQSCMGLCMLPLSLVAGPLQILTFTQKRATFFYNTF